MSIGNAIYGLSNTGSQGTISTGCVGFYTKTCTTGTVGFAVPVMLAAYTVASLPSGTVGDTAYVSDATTCVFGTAPTGSGSVKCPVFYNGSAWVGG